MRTIKPKTRTSTKGQESSSPLTLAQTRTLEARDGVTLSYEVLGDGRRTLLLANGLGGRLYAWKPLIEALWQQYRIITWDYRGIFASSAPSSTSRLSVRDHAEDALQILDAERVDRAAWVGWSMGVQVSLEAAAIRPERFSGLVLLNGTYGHVFSSGFQPGIRLPILPRYMHEIIDRLYHRPDWYSTISRMARKGTFISMGLISILFGRRSADLRPMLKQYMEDVYQPSHFGNYLRLFQELDAHSAYHHLRDIDVPALVVSGGFDILTPPYQSREIARKLPRAERLHIRKGSHFVLIERPEEVVPPIRSFLDERARWN